MTFLLKIISVKPVVNFVICLIACLQVCSLVVAQVNPTPATERLKSIEQRAALEKKSILNDIKFRNIGPSIMSGRVVDLDVNPEDPTEFYVAYATGGLWWTTNNGQSFTPVFDSTDVLFIGDIAVNWNKPVQQRMIWVGTGEVNSSRSSYAGIGVYKTSDNGKHWEYLGLPESHHIGKIQLHPADENTAWVAALGHLYSANKERGVYKTTDGGKTWKQTLYVDDNTGAVDLDINPQNPNELYAAMWYRTRRAWKFEESGATSGIYKSNDGGETWKKLSGDGSGFMTGNKIGRIGIAVFPINPSIVYAIVDNNTPQPDSSAKKQDSLYKKNDFKDMGEDAFLLLKDNLLDTFLRNNNFPQKYTTAVVKEMVKNKKIKPTALFDFLDFDDGFQNTGIYGAEVYRSDDGGMTWKKMNEKFLTLYSTYGYYFGKIYVSPVNENKVVITGVPLLMSTDGGKTFRNIDKRNVHGDHHSIWINPKRDSHIINGNDGGCNITYDNGEHWFFANTPPVGQYYAVTTDNDRPYNVYGGLQDNNVWYGPSTNRDNEGWQSTGDYPYKSLVGGDGMQVQVDTRDNATTYAGSQFGVYSRLNRKTRSDRKSVRPVHELGEKPLRFNWQSPILLSRHNQDIFYIAANKLYRSLNKGDSLVAISEDLSNGKKEGNVPYGTITSIAESPTRFGLLYAGTDDGNIYVSKENGYNWQKLILQTKAKSGKKEKTETPPAGLWVSRIIASQWKEGRVYVSLNGYRNDHFLPYLFVSDDYGMNWKRIDNDLPNEPINVVREDPKNDSILYVGTDGGLYVSFDQGNHFMMWNGGLPKSVPVHDIAIQTRENEIVLGTHGRSLYIAKLDDVQKLKQDPDWLKKKPKEKTQESPEKFSNLEQEPDRN
ncbi:MAG: glycosyl hydrolase [Chitinophagaceae bacterium]